MILIDANLLLYAAVRDFDAHPAARRWLDERLNEPIRVGLPWESLLAFLRIGTNPRVFSRPLTMDQGWRIVESWLELPTVWTPTPVERHGEILSSLLRDGAGTSKLVADAHLAALAIGHGLELCSTDGDFARFRDLRWRDPLRAA